MVEISKEAFEKYKYNAQINIFLSAWMEQHHNKTGTYDIERRDLHRVYWARCADCGLEILYSDLEFLDNRRPEVPGLCSANPVQGGIGELAANIEPWIDLYKARDVKIKERENRAIEIQDRYF